MRESLSIDIECGSAFLSRGRAKRGQNKHGYYENHDEKKRMPSVARLCSCWKSDPPACATKRRVPFGFLVSGARAQGLFLRRHLAAVAQYEGVLLAVGAFYAPVS